MNKIISVVLILFFSSTIALAEPLLARSIICIKNNTNKIYVLDVQDSDPFWEGNPFFEGRDVSFPIIGNKPGSNLDDKVIPPRKHVCKKQEINFDGIDKSSASAKVAGASEKIDTFTVTVSGYEPLVAGTLTFNDRAPVATARNYFYVAVTNGSVHWTTESEKGPGPEKNGQTDEGFMYSSEFVNEFGEIREIDECPAPYKHDKDCQLFEILN